MKINKVVTAIFFIAVCLLVKSLVGSGWLVDDMNHDGKNDKVWQLIENLELKKAEELLLREKEGGDFSKSDRATLGFIYLEQGQLDLAKDQFLRVVQDVLGVRRISELTEKEKHILSLGYLGMAKIFIFRGDYEEAQNALLKANTAYPNILVHALLGYATRKIEKDLPIAEKFHEEVSMRSPQFGLNQALLAILYAEKGQPEKGRELLKNILDKEKYLLESAAFYSLAGEIDLALEALKKYIGLYGDYPERWHVILDFIQHDSDFHNLSSSKQFQRFLSGFQV